MKRRLDSHAMAALRAPTVARHVQLCAAVGRVHLRRWLSSTAPAASAAAVQAARGMHDVLPAEHAARAFITRTFYDIARAGGYEPIETPIVEDRRVYDRSLGDATDIVTKEMYAVTATSNANADGRGGADSCKAQSLVLRPEGTAGVVRAAINGKLVQAATGSPVRVAYSGPMFRHERPQQGRYRQFNQLGLECLGGGVEGPAGPASVTAPATLDVETIRLAHTFLASIFPAHLQPVLHLNTLGSTACMHSYAAALKDYFTQCQDQLSPESVARFQREAFLRILDSKHPQDAPIVAAAPPVTASLSAEARRRFDAVCDGLAALGVPFHVDATLVRGLDYYRHTIFEFKIAQAPTSATGEGEGQQQAPGAGAGQLGTVLAGGRYDGLIEAMGGPKGTPAIGWAAGLERLAILAGDAAAARARSIQRIAVLPIGAGGAAASDVAGGRIDARLVRCMVLADALQSLQAAAGGAATDGKSITVLHSARAPGKQIAAASKAGADVVIMIGDDELASGSVKVKHLRSGKETVIAGALPGPSLTAPGASGSSARQCSEAVLAAITSMQ